MKTPKEIAINYLKNINKDRVSALNEVFLFSEEGTNLLVDIDILCRAIRIVEESEGE